MNNPTKSTSFYALAMYMFAKRLHNELTAVYERCCSENVSLISVFMRFEGVTFY